MSVPQIKAIADDNRFYKTISKPRKQTTQFSSKRLFQTIAERDL